METGDEVFVGRFHAGWMGQVLEGGTGGKAKKGLTRWVLNLESLRA